MSFIDLKEKNPHARMMKMLGKMAAMNGNKQRAHTHNMMAAQASGSPKLEDVLLRVQYRRNNDLHS